MNQLKGTVSKKISLFLMYESILRSSLKIIIVFNV